MKTKTGFSIAMSLALFAAITARAAGDPPADPTLAGDTARSVGAAVKHDAKVVADATKDGAAKVAEVAKAVAHEVATASKEGAHDVAAAAKRGAEKTKAVVNGEKAPDKAPSSPAKPAESN